MAGLWGVVSVGLFGNVTQSGVSVTNAGNSGQLLAQFVGIATLIGFVLPLTYGVNWFLNRIYSQRVSSDGERQGMDLHELGAGAYPDFMTHSEEFTPHKL
jgi:Amt family ammonium transporter